MTAREKEGLRFYVKVLLREKYTDAEIVRKVVLNGYSATTGRNYIKAHKK